MANFKIVEVKAYKKAEAVEQVMESNGIQVIRDATAAWKKAGCPVGSKALNEFCSEYLKSVTKFAAGIGCSITIEAGVSDTRERPYTVKDVKNEKGKRKFKKAFQLIDKETGEILGVSFGTKKAAETMAKDLYIKNGYKGNIVCKIVHEVVEGEVIAFEVAYTPSKSTQLGSYLVFGVEA